MRQINKNPWTRLLLMLVLLGISGVELEAKEIIKDAASKKSVNRLLIRVDGLACYFCAYGLERFFKKSGRIAAFDMKMEEGIVEATPIKGKPLLSVETVSKYIYDAGFTFRSIKAVLVGRFEQKDDRVIFRVSDTGEGLPIRKNSVLERILTDENLISQEIQMIAVAEKEKGVPMALVIEKVKPWAPKEG